MNQTQEIWKKVKNYEDSYEISNLGNIRSLDRKVKSGYGSVSTKKGKVLKPHKDKDGYLHIGLYRNQKSKDVRIHRLVAEHFIENTYNKDQINYINDIKDDNRVENLEWCTGKENQQHAIKNGYRDNVVKKGKDSNWVKLSENDIIFIRTHYNKKTLNYNKLAQMFDVTPSAIGLIIRKVNWKHI